MHGHMHADKRTAAYTHARAQVLHTDACTHTRTRTHMPTYVHNHARAHWHTYTQTHARAQRRTHTRRAHTHTNKIKTAHACTHIHASHTFINFGLALNQYVGAHQTCGGVEASETRIEQRVDCYPFIAP